MLLTLLLKVDIAVNKCGTARRSARTGSDTIDLRSGESFTSSPCQVE
jgi:hypothetical protein